MCLAISAAIYMANAVTKKNREGNKDYTVDYYKLHKLLYISQGVMLAKHGKRLFQEDITAHSCGVFVSSYCGEQYLGGLDPYYSEYGIKEITEEIEDGICRLLTSDRKQILDYVADKYGSDDRDNLIFVTKEHQPYVEAYNKRSEDNPKPQMSDDSIQDFFLEHKNEFYPDII